VNIIDAVKVPRGWIRTSLGDVCSSVDKVSPAKEISHVEFTYLDIASIDNLSLQVVEPKKYLGKFAPSRAKQKVHYDFVQRNLISEPPITRMIIHLGRYKSTDPNTGIHNMHAREPASAP
jgi:type I restriction enzyme S subunit